MKMMKTAGIVAACLVTSGSALAGPFALYPGVMCKYYGKQALDTFFDPNNGSANRLRNTDTSTRNVTCPVVLSAWTPINYARMGVSGTGWTNASCDFYVRAMDGGSTIIRGGFYAASEQQVWFDLSPLSFPPNQTAAVYCRVPAGAWVNWYGIAQQ